MQRNGNYNNKQCLQIKNPDGKQIMKFVDKYMSELKVFTINKEHILWLYK